MANKSVLRHDAIITWIVEVPRNLNDLEINEYEMLLQVLSKCIPDYGCSSLERRL